MTKPDKLKAALEAGELWRAREILAGRIGVAPFRPALCEQLGQVLLRMGDDLEAGKYLFLSGVRHPEYERAIQLFVRRYSRGGWQSLLGSLPAAARRAAWKDLPQTVTNELRELGVPIRGEAEALRETLERAPARASRRGCLTILVVALVIGVLVGYLAVLVSDWQAARAR